MRLRSHSAGGCPGFTLIELLVVLVVLGLTVVLVPPAIVPREERRSEHLQSVVNAARRAAVRRAGPVVLRVGSDGGWLMLDPADFSGRPLATGDLPRPPAWPVEVRITPIGACMPAVVQSAALTIDPVGCRILTATGIP